MSDAELDAKLQHSYTQSIAGEGRSLGDVFDDPERSLGQVNSDEIIVTPGAEAGLYEIRDYIAETLLVPDVALKYIRVIRKEVRISKFLRYMVWGTKNRTMGRVFILRITLNLRRNGWFADRMTASLPQ